MDTPYTGRTPIPGMDDETDRLVAMIAALTSELAVVRDRLDTLERVLEHQGGLPDGAMDTFTPDQAAADARDSRRRRLIAKVFRPLRDAAARAAEKPGKDTS